MIITIYGMAVPYLRCVGACFGHVVFYVLDDLS